MTVFGMPLSTVFLYFVFYSVFGWTIETVFCSINERRFVRRGFLFGPVCPIYGTGALIIIMPLSRLKGSLFLFVLASVILMTALEYFVGWLLEKTTGLKYWDYSHYKLNIKGRVCPIISLAWGVLAYAVVFWLHPPVSRFFESIPPDTATLLAWVLFVIMLIDTALTLHKLSVIARMLKKLEQKRVEINEKLLAVMDTDGDGRISREELKASYEQLLQRLRLQLQSYRRRFPKLSSIRYKQILPEETKLRFGTFLQELKDRFKKV